MPRDRTFTHRVRATLLAACILASCGCAATPSARTGDAPASRDRDYDVIVRHGTPAERMAMVWQITLDVWASSGRKLPEYTRATMPGRIIRSGQGGHG